jgi:FkbM family methyltransferase
MKIVYDFGANNGINIPYYFSKFDKIVAVDANPAMTEQIKNKFKKEIENNRLVVVNCVLSEFENNVDFYIHKDNDVLSSAVLPKDPENYKLVTLPSKKASDIVFEFGEPNYIKIDVEHMDFFVIKDLFQNKIYPDYISAECHDVKVFSLLVSSEQYKSYKLLDGASINSIYGDKFPYHSAGPIWEDIKEKELDAEELFYELAEKKLGWKDIHAKRKS